jgi:NAD(P)-dependent dehydrogenase (short-subunit alcohol dehydrogenase family)
MASKFLFQGRIAIVTGAGGGLGKAYALELAKRGATLLINDPGGSVNGTIATGSGSGSGTGTGTANRPAFEVAKFINDNGGRAIANYESVSTGGQSIIEHAMKEFGKVDILVNNAGILRDKSFQKMTIDDWNQVMDVHLNGTFKLCHSVWPHMISSKYGRIVNIGSGAGLYGNFGQANYSSAKMGILGMTNTLALEGSKSNININCIVPVAGSRMTEGLLPPNILEILDPRHVANIVSYLCHESSSESGSCFEVGGGWYSKVRIQRSGGIKLGDKDTFAAVEDIANHMKDISNFENSTNPKNPADIIKDIIATPIHTSGKPNTRTEDSLNQVSAKISSSSNNNNNNNNNNSSSSNSSSSSSSSSSNSSASPAAPEQLMVFKSDSIFSKLRAVIDADPAKSTELVKQVRAFIQFDIADKTQGATKHWLLDAKTPSPSFNCVMSKDAIPSTWKPYTVIQISDENFVSLIEGKLSPEFAYLRGTLKIEGSMGVALRIKQLIALAK